MILYPAIDLMDGACIRLSQGNYALKNLYHSNPLKMAKEFEANGATHLHLVDLDGARAGDLVNTEVIQSICQNTSLSVDLGGGIKSLDIALKAFELGVERVNIGSLALNSPSTFVEMLKRFGPESCILSVDVKQNLVASNAWSHTSQLHWKDFIGQFLEHGLGLVTSTDIEKDGMLNGPGFSLYKELKDSFPQLKVIASGGVSSLSDIRDLRELKLHGAIIGKALYEKKIPLNVFTQQEFGGDA